MPALIESFFLCNFNLVRFKESSEELIRYTAIKKYIINLEENKMLQYMNRMLAQTEFYSFNIDKDFPKDTLIRIMKPYIKLYILSLYSYNSYTKKNMQKILDSRLYDFYTFNPKFGIKIYKTKDKKIHEHHFNERHIDFTKNMRKNTYFHRYDNSHLVAY